jgi:hypothetical protein
MGHSNKMDNGYECMRGHSCPRNLTAKPNVAIGLQDLIKVVTPLFSRDRPPIPLLQ